MEWQRASGELASLRRERDELLQAVEQRKGPWFDKVGGANGGQRLLLLSRCWCFVFGVLACA
jgi:hypothetical protein